MKKKFDLTRCPTKERQLKNIVLYFNSPDNNNPTEEQHGFDDEDDLQFIIGNPY